MAYSDWTLETVKKAFQLEEANAAGIFGEVPPRGTEHTSCHDPGTQCAISLCHGH